MKKSNFICLSVFFILLFFSCSGDYENLLEDTNVVNSESDSKTKSSGDEKYDVLGYGYFITKPYAHRDAVSQYQVIDIEKLIATEPSKLVYFDKGAYSGTYTRVYSGEDHFSYIKEVTTKTNFSASVASNGITKTLTAGLFSADVKASQETKSKVSYSSAYSCATAEIFSSHRRFIIDTELSIAQKYLSPYFKQELEKVNTLNQAYNLVEKFGTHVLFKFTTGGIFKSEFRGLTWEEGNLNSKKQTAEIGAKYGLSKIGLGGTVGWEQTTTTQINSKNINWNGEIKSYGGNTNGLTINISPTEGTSYSLNVGSWIASINDKNAVLVDLDWNKTYPIYMLIADNTKAELIKTAVNNFIKNKQAENDTLYPIYRYWNSKTQESYLTNKYESKSGWNFDKVIGYSALRTYGNEYSAGQGGFTQLFQYKHIKNNTYYFSAETSSQDPRLGNPLQYKKESSLGCIRGQAYKPSDMRNYVALHRFWNKSKNTFYITDNTNDARMNSNWQYEKVIAYVLYK